MSQTKSTNAKTITIEGDQTVLSLPAMDPVMRGIWRSVSKKSPTVTVEEKDAVATQECKQEADQIEQLKSTETEQVEEITQE